MAAVKLTVTLAVALAAGCARTALPPAGGAAPAPHGPAPAAAPPGSWGRIPIVDLERRPATLAGVMGGRPALVNLWAPWCESCMTELPDLDRLSRQYDGCGLVIGVAVGEDPDHTAAFVRGLGLGYPQYVDEGYQLADAFRQSRIPATLVLDGDGTIVHAGLALDGAAVGALRTALARAPAGGACRRP